jgi:hypothetical protein
VSLESLESDPSDVAVVPELLHKQRIRPAINRSLNSFVVDGDVDVITVNVPQTIVC